MRYMSVLIEKCFYHRNRRGAGKTANRQVIYCLLTKWYSERCKQGRRTWQSHGFIIRKHMIWLLTPELQSVLVWLKWVNKSIISCLEDRFDMWWFITRWSGYKTRDIPGGFFVTFVICVVSSHWLWYCVSQEVHGIFQTVGKR